MATQHYQRVKEVFQAVCELPEAERSEFLSRTCCGDSTLLHDVEDLLRVESRCTGFMDVSPMNGAQFMEGIAAAIATHEVQQPLPVSIGRYRIVRLIGEGGMGSVFEAVQDVPKRLVALKVIRGGLLSPKLRERFRNEVEILGRLRHKGIAQIFDAGVTQMQLPNGNTGSVPYFAMEFVAGVPLTDHARAHKLGDRDRLRLLADVCDAVHYGHLQGVIHRDLKPANILVEETGEAKVIDFGVARATNSDVAVTTMHTDAAQIIGTLAYMSPEQVAGSLQSVDARTDVYSLGVIGYELLSDRLPFDLAGMLVPQAARVIQEAEPSRLSSISRVYRGDIETIIGKALEKEPARRYQSATELATDIRRYLDNEPIIARPPSIRYQLGKFARRHKELVAGLTLVFLVLIGGIIATSITMMHAQQQARDATKFAKRATTSSEFMRRVLASANPIIEGGGRDVRVADVLEDAVSQLDQATNLDPETELDARWTIGESYLGLGLHEQALANLSRALELANRIHHSTSRDSLGVANTLAWVLLDLDRYSDAKAVIEPAVDSATEEFGMADRLTQNLLYTAACVAGAASDCESNDHHIGRLYNAIRDIPQDERAVDMRTVLLSMATTCQHRGDWALAERWITEALTEPVVASNYTALRVRRGTSFAQVLTHQRMWSKAESAWTELLTANERRYGPSHAETRDALDGLIELHQRRGDFAKALRARERQLDDFSTAKLPPKDFAVGMIWGNIGALLARMHHVDESARAFVQAIAICRNSQGDDFWVTQAWWREAVIRLGMGLHEPWSSDALRWHCLRGVADGLTRTPTCDFDFNEIDWATFGFILERYEPQSSDPSQPQGLIQVSSGNLAALKAMNDPTPGIYRLAVHADRHGREPLQESVWMLFAPWSVRTFKAWPCSIFNQELWQRVAATSPVEERTLATLCYSNWWETGYGPDHGSQWFGLTAEAEIHVPENDYDLVVHADNGARVWIDANLVLEQWSERGWAVPPEHRVQVRLSNRSHHLRIEHFQGMGDARLWVRLEPRTMTLPIAD